MAATSEGQIQVDLSGQVALVTGASRGIGRGIALALARCGALVVCVARSEDKLKETVGEITASGGKAVLYTCDVTNGDAVTKLVEQVAEEHKRLDILVNNAGITRDTLVPRMSDEQWDEVIDTNLRGAFLFTRAATRPMMGQRYGRVINIASVSGLMGNPGQANYSASKAGLIGMTRTVARELAGRKITVNALAPGFIESEMTAALGDSIMGEVKTRIPAKRIGTVAEVAEAVLFLASRAAGYITGQVLVIDGGMTA
ncbi:MAG TPA: 3-oxoacyl-[acyl-carrier-protein] reductase [Pirellulales bacterium]|jgi:3-oxoacyl-[acyl-carrier protein] reductase|nr:3-oxoacyl-[acyl-carrier-protein] reductase [Pirellulales bacterium]